MAYGTDIWAGNIVARLKFNYPAVKLIAAIPFPDFTLKWDEEWKILYKRLLDNCDLIKYIGNKYESGIYQMRNEWMVDHSGKLVAVYDGVAGGTRNTIQYARRHNISVSIIQ